MRFNKLSDESFWVDEIGHTLAIAGVDFRSVIENIRVHAGAAPLDYGIFLENPWYIWYLNGRKDRLEMGVPYLDFDFENFAWDAFINS